MRVPYFKAKDKDSEVWVEGFYVEFPEHADLSRECRLIHAIMVVVLDPTPLPMMPMMGAEAQKTLQETMKRNTLNFVTIDMSTLQQIGEVEIGGDYYKPEAYIKNPHSQIILG